MPLKNKSQKDMCCTDGAASGPALLAAHGGEWAGELSALGIKDLGVMLGKGSLADSLVCQRNAVKVRELHCYKPQYNRASI